MSFFTISPVIKKILLVASFWLLVTGLFTPTTYAQDAEGDEFATSYDVIYDVTEDGSTLVTEKISLKNLTSESYADQFRLIIGATQISDIKASDEGGTMETSSKTEDSSTTIDVKFNQQVAGLGKSLNWTLQFRSKDFAEKIGKVWEVRAPKISSNKNLEKYNLTISVPQSFGDPTLITPIPKTQTSSNGRMFLVFEKNQITQAGVSASFGQNQLFDFDLYFFFFFFFFFKNKKKFFFFKKKIIFFPPPSRFFFPGCHLSKIRT